MSLSLSRVASIATVVAIVAGCAAASDGSASADEAPAQATTQALTPEITTTEFVADFGKPAVVAGTNALDCGIGEVRLFAGPMPTRNLGPQQTP